MNPALPRFDPSPAQRRVLHLGIALSLLLHGALLLQYQVLPALAAPEQAGPVTVSLLPPALDPPIAPPEEMKPEPPPPPPPKPKEEEPPPLLHTQAPTPALAPPPPPKGVEEVAVEETIAKEVEEEVAQPQADPTPPVTAAAPPPRAVASPDERAAFLGRLIAHLEAHKFYPNTARRRGIEGVVRLGFWLQEGGGAVHVEADGGVGSLCAAAMEALERALPLPAPPEGFTLPMKIEVALEYRLR